MSTGKKYDEEKKRLSIIMMVYNQGKFINKAILSVVNKLLPGNWKLLIGDNHSANDTKNEIKFRIDKSPNILFITIDQKNKGLHANYVSFLKT